MLFNHAKGSVVGLTLALSLPPTPPIPTLSVGSKTIYAGFILQVIGLIVWPVSFKQFGEPCEETGQYACGQVCSGTAEFDYFAICEPWELGLHFVIGCVGVAAQMIAAIVFSSTKVA